MTRTKSTYLALLAVLLSPMAANADLINWEFTPDSGGTVAGTISGLVEGSNDGTGLTVTVDSTPTGELEGLVWNFMRIGLGSGGDAFTVLAGEIIYADAFFGSGPPLGSYTRYRMFFGGYDGYYTQLADYGSTSPDWKVYNTGEGTISYTSVPEPSTLALLGIGLFGMGLARRRRKT